MAEQTVGEIGQHGGACIGGAIDCLVRTGDRPHKTQHRIYYGEHDAGEDASDAGLRAIVMLVFDAHRGDVRGDDNAEIEAGEQVRSSGSRR